MEVKIFLTADFANTDGAGKLNVLGVFTQIHAHTIPVVLSQMHVIVQFEFDSSESGQHRVIFIRLFDPDDKELITIPNEFDIPQTKYAQTVQINVLAGIQRMVFEKFGRYSFKLFMGDSHEVSVTVDVLNVTQPREQQSEG